MIKNYIVRSTYLLLLSIMSVNADISQNDWWLAHKKNDSVAQYKVANVYNPHFESRSWYCGYGQFYLDAKTSEGGGCKEQSSAKYITWLMKSANNNYPLAQVDLGEQYIRGEWVDKDVKQGLYWLNKAAEPTNTTPTFRVGEGTLWLKAGNFSGVGRAQFLLGQLYDKGIDVKPDYQTAIKYYQRASASYDWGFKNSAQYQLYKLYQDKLHDPKLAFHWLQVTANGVGQFADKRTLDTPLLVVKHYLDGGQPDGSVSDTPNYLWAARWLLKVSDNSNLSHNQRGQAHLLLAWLYLNGLGIERDVTTSIDHYIKGIRLADKPEAEADLLNKQDLQVRTLNFIVSIYENKIDEEEANQLLATLFVDDVEQERLFFSLLIDDLESKIQSDHPNRFGRHSKTYEQLLKLAENRNIAYGYYQHAKLLAPDKASQAIELYQVALSLAPNDANILYRLATTYDFYLQAPQKAIDFYREAVELGHAKATFRLGVLYYLGHGVTQDYKQAWLLLDKAAQASYLPAQMFVMQIDSTHREADWLKEQYLAHQQLYRSPAVVVDGNDWLALQSEQETTVMASYHWLRREEPYDKAFGSYLLCKTAQAYAKEGNIELQQRFIAQIKLETYSIKCSPGNEQMLTWIDNSERPEQEKRYLAALFYKIIGEETKSNTLMQQLVTENYSDAYVYLANKLRHQNNAGIKKSLQYAQEALKQGNANGAEILLLYYQQSCCGSKKNPNADIFQYNKMMLIRNDLAQVYDSSPSYLSYSYQRYPQKYIYADGSLSQSEIYRIWFEIASMHEQGKAIPKNLIMAYVWYRLLDEHQQVGAHDKVTQLTTLLTEQQQQNAEQIVNKHRRVYQFYPLTYIKN